MPWVNSAALRPEGPRDPRRCETILTPKIPVQPQSIGLPRKGSQGIFVGFLKRPQEARASSAVRRRRTISLIRDI
jgi:hypothetical protein